MKESVGVKERESNWKREREREREREGERNPTCTLDSKPAIRFSCSEQKEDTCYHYFCKQQHKLKNCNTNIKNAATKRTAWF